MSENADHLSETSMLAEAEDSPIEAGHNPAETGDSRADAEDSPAEATDGAHVTKDRFKEALERKRTRQHANNGEGQSDSKVHGEHARAGAKRNFRRKSGG